MIRTESTKPQVLLCVCVCVSVCVCVCVCVCVPSLFRVPRLPYPEVGRVGAFLKKLGVPPSDGTPPRGGGGH